MRSRIRGIEEGMMSFGCSRAGYSLIELMTVLVIVAIIVGIAVPTIKNGQSQRELANSVNYFATNLQWATTEARKSGQRVFLGFKCTYDRNQVEAPLGREPQDDIWEDGFLYLADNPGVRRVAAGYYFVKEQPRVWGAPDPAAGPQPGTPAEGTPYTYRDFLNELIAGNLPREPVFPIDIGATIQSGERTEGSYVNRTATPKFFYPMDLDTGSTYLASFIGDAYQAGALDFSTDVGLQENKLFCIADTAEIILFDVDDPEPMDNKVTYEVGIDHPLLEAQIVDYVLLREMDLPPSVYAYNPYQDKFLISYDGSLGAGSEVYSDFQALQFLYAINPDGGVEVWQWTYDPEPFPDGSTTGLIHGHLEKRPAAPLVYYLFFVTEEVIDPESGFAIMANRRAQNSGSGRLVTIWPLNGRYFVDDYTPNDVSRFIDDGDERFDRNSSASDYGRYVQVTAYRRNYLVPSE